MRHRKSFNHLSRKRGHRKAMLSNMAASLIIHKKIKTTTAKAKALRMFIEPLITKSKDDSTHSRRVVFSYLQNKDAVSELFREVSPRIVDRPGGYTRILKTGTRLGDNADMCVIELVDYNENLLKAKSEAEVKTSRRRRRAGKKKPLEPGKIEEKAEAEAEAEEKIEEKAEAEAKAEEKIEEKAEAEAEAEKKVEKVEEVEEVEEKAEDKESPKAESEPKKKEETDDKNE